MREHLKQWGGSGGVRLAIRMQRAQEEEDKRPGEDKLLEEQPMLEQLAGNIPPVSHDKGV